MAESGNSSRNEEACNLDELKRLYIEPTSLCNLNCDMCFRNTWFDEKLCDLPLDLFRSVVKNMPSTVETVFFGGMGEPLFHKDIIEMVKLASGKVNSVELLTNGTLLDESMSKALIDAGLTKLWVSMDMFEPEHGQENKGHGNFEAVESNIRTFNTLRGNLETEPELCIAFVASKSNVAQLANLGGFVTKHRVQEVNVSNMYPSDAASEKETVFSRTLNLGLGSDTVQSQNTIVKMPLMDWDIDELAEGMRKILMNALCTVQLGSYPVSRRSRYCRFIEESMAFIRSDGDVSPCMALLHNGTTCLNGTKRRILHHSFGNVRNTGLQKIWQSNEYAAFREKVRKFYFSPCIYCGHCDNASSNIEDCLGNVTPTCGACLWAEGFLSCP